MSSLLLHASFALNRYSSMSGIIKISLAAHQIQRIRIPVVSLASQQIWVVRTYVLDLEHRNHAMSRVVQAPDCAACYEAKSMAKLSQNGSKSLHKTFNFKELYGEQLKRKCVKL